jgi:type III restriction enzyme
MAASKSVFNLVPCDNEFEKEFAQFFGEGGRRFAICQAAWAIWFRYRLPESRWQFPLLRADFVALTSDGTHYIVETKGLEDVNVANKDRAAHLWCENTTSLTRTPWAYLKVLQTEYKRLQPTAFSDLTVLRSLELFS